MSVIQGLAHVLPETSEAALAVQAVGDDLVDSIVGDNIPILTEAEKFNETVISSVKRVSARLLGARAALPCVCSMWPLPCGVCWPVWGAKCTRHHDPPHGQSLAVTLR